MKSHIYNDMESNRNDWWMKGKIAIVLDVIKQQGFSKDAKICDVGAGAGLMLEALRNERYTNLTGSDSFPESLELLRKKNFIVVDGTLPYLRMEKKFDLLLLLDVLEHIEEDGAALDNLQTSLRPGGCCILTVPAFQFLWTKKDQDLMHKRRYTRGDLKSILQKHGFYITFLSYYNFFLFPLACIYSFLNKKQNSIKRYGSAQDRILYPIFKSEKYYLRRQWKFPFGVSLIAIVRKPL